MKNLLEKLKFFLDEFKLEKILEEKEKELKDLKSGAHGYHYTGGKIKVLTKDINDIKYKINIRNISNWLLVLLLIILSLSTIFMKWLIKSTSGEMIAFLAIVILTLIIIIYILFDMTTDKISSGVLSLFKIFGVFLIAVYVALVLLWISEPEVGIMIQPFEISNLGKNMSGTSVADLLSSELQDIADTNERIQNETHLAGIENYKIEIPSLHSKSIESSLTSVGSFGSGGSSLSLGQLSFSLRRLLHTQPTTIRGSVNRYGSMVYLVAEIEESNSPSISIYKVNCSLNGSNELPDQTIPSLVMDLAYQIALGLGKNENESEGKLPQTWQAFKYANEGQKEYLEYIYTGNDSHLYSSGKNAELAMKFEPNYKSIRSLYYLIGYKFYDEEKYVEAQRIFGDMEKKFEDYNATIMLGLAYYRHKDFKNATDAFNRTLKMNPKNYLAWFLKGNSLYSQALYEKADLAYDKALFYNDSFEKAWNMRGMIYLYAGNIAEAINAFSNATENADLFGRAWYNKGRALYCRGDYDQANESFNKAAKRNYFQAWNYIGLISYKSGNYNMATKFYDYYLTNDSGDEINNAIVYFNQGMAYYSYADYSQAVNSFDEATWRFENQFEIGVNESEKSRISPDNKCLGTIPTKTWSDAWKYKGNSYEKLNKKDQADQAYNRSNEIYEMFTIESEKKKLVSEIGNINNSIINITFTSPSQS